MFQFNGIQLHQLPIWLEMLLGIALGAVIDFHNGIVSEGKVTEKKYMYILFLVGFIYPFFRPIDLSLNNGVLIISAYTSYFLINLIRHIKIKEYFEESINRQFIFKTYTRKKGYIESKNIYNNDNAWTTRFGLIILGIKSHRSIFDQIFRCSGWSKEQEKGIYSHERGHYVIGKLMFLLEILIGYIFLNNLITHFSIFSILLYPTYFTAITLLSWLDELLADTCAGKYGEQYFEYMENIYKDKLPKPHYIGGIGYSSHPSYILRIFAYYRIFIFVLFILEIYTFKIILTHL